jgi:propionyl-CoA synthetase
LNIFNWNKIKLVSKQIGAVTLRNVSHRGTFTQNTLGKTLRKLMRSIADGDDYQIPSTIDDEAIVEEIVLINMKLEFIIKNNTNNIKSIKA